MFMGAQPIGQGGEGRGGKGGMGGSFFFFDFFFLTFFLFFFIYFWLFCLLFFFVFRELIESARKKFKDNNIHQFWYRFLYFIFFFSSSFSYFLTFSLTLFSLSLSSPYIPKTNHNNNIDKNRDGTPVFLDNFVAPLPKKSYRFPLPSLSSLPLLSYLLYIYIFISLIIIIM